MLLDSSLMKMMMDNANMLMESFSSNSTKKSVVVLSVMDTEECKPKHALEKRARDGMLTHLMYVILVTRHLRNQMLVWNRIIAETQMVFQQFGATQQT